MGATSGRSHREGEYSSRDLRGRFVGKCGKGIPGTGKSKRKGPEVGVLACLRNSKGEASVAEAG